MFCRLHPNSFQNAMQIHRSSVSQLFWKMHGCIWVAPVLRALKINHRLCPEKLIEIENCTGDDHKSWEQGKFGQAASRWCQDMLKETRDGRLNEAPGHTLEWFHLQTNQAENGTIRTKTFTIHRKSKFTVFSLFLVTKIQSNEFRGEMKRRCFVGRCRMSDVDLCSLRRLSSVLPPAFARVRVNFLSPSVDFSWKNTHEKREQNLSILCYQSNKGAYQRRSRAPKQTVPLFAKRCR